MKILKQLLLVICLATPLSTSGLSRSIGRDIEFPKNYNPEMANEIRQVVQDKQFNFLEGLVSYWPPDWSTRLSFKGDVGSLNTFITKLHEIKGLGLRLILYHGRDDERRRDSDWQLAFSHARPKQLTIYLNLNAKNIDLTRVKLPEWKTQD